MRAVLCLTLLALIGAAMAQNWFHIVLYSDSTCSDGNWIGYTSNRVGTCVKTSAVTWQKFDCGTFTGATCTDDKCTQCGANTDLSNYRNCQPVTQGSTTYTKGYCGGLSSPFPGSAQFQYRQYPVPGASNTLDCTTAMVTASGAPANKCFAANGGTFTQYTCSGNVPTLESNCDSTCANCQVKVAQNVTCAGGVMSACGVGAASGVVVSIATIALMFISAVLMF